MHVFVHNGRLPGIEQRLADIGRRFLPVGSTDSEVAFCLLLSRLAPLWDAGMPPAAQRLREVCCVAETLRAIGPANFLYTDGDLLIAHAHRRTQHDGSVAPPGLWMLERTCAVDRDTLPAAGVMLDRGQQVTLFASVPLTEEPWRPLGEGEVVAVRDGAPS
jgi:glutamine amidotransferase